MKSIRNYTLIFCCFALLCCVDSIHAQVNLYLGQTPPTNFVRKFKPNGYLANNVWWWAGSPTFSPDGNEMYFVKYFPGKSTHEIWHTKCINGIWQPQQVAPFSKSNDDRNPYFTSSNDTMYFFPRGVSTRFIYRIIRTVEGWSEPELVNIPIPADKEIVSFAVSENKTFFLSLMGTASSDYMENYKTSEIYCSRLSNGEYAEPENLGSVLNSSEGDAISYIDPDGKFIFFGSLRPGGFGYHDIYFSQINNDGAWNPGLQLSSMINTAQENFDAKITPDGKYLFFITEKYGDYGYSPYWIESNFIYDMLTSVNKKENDKLPSEYMLSQNYPNPFNPSTTINYKIKEAKPVKVKISVFNLLGKEVAILLDTEQGGGEYEIKLEAGNLTSGVYFYELKIDGIRKDVRKLNLIK